MAQQVRTDDMIVVKADQLADTAQTRGMWRRAGVAGSNVGAKAIWLGRGGMAAKTYSGAHHHGESESAIFVLKGRARFRFGPNLEKSVDVEEGDFIYIPAYCLHQEINPNDSEAELIVARSHYENIVVNIDLPESVEKPPRM